MTLARCSSCGKDASESPMTRYCIFAMDHKPFLCDPCYERKEDDRTLYAQDSMDAVTRSHRPPIKASSIGHGPQLSTTTGMVLQLRG